MYTFRELLAVALAAVLGLVLVAKPNAALRLQWFTFDTSSGRHGEWGNPDEEREFDGKWLWLVRAIGVVVLAVGAAILAVPVL
jgi:hypothetical protein